ncbi:hypothetical protein GCM10010129_84730 [Streptomyces fumigatiscleroticus]|nr:hypothetical protein GCM10010129_84730 [Streptomyces fumigatiscleroticus]
MYVDWILYVYDENLEKRVAYNTNISIPVSILIFRWILIP